MNNIKKINKLLIKVRFKLIINFNKLKKLNK